MQADRQTQRGARSMDAERIDHGTVQTGHRANVEPNTHVNQRNFGRFRIIAEQLNINVAMAGGMATPNGAPQIGAKARQPIQPLQRQFTQGTQLDGLGVGAEKRNMRLYRTFELIIVRLRRARRQPELFDGLALGGTVVQPIVHNQARRHHSDFIGHSIHGSIVHP